MNNLLKLALSLIVGLFAAEMFFGLQGCAQGGQAQVTVYNMSWRCYTQYCYFHVTPNSWGGNGQFSNETDCLAWETGFLNTAGANNGGGVTACTASN